MAVNRFIRGKKAQIYLPILAFMVLVLMTYAVVELQHKQTVPRDTGPIGQNTLDVVSKIQEGEKARIFMDSASKFALYQALYNLQASGGITDSSDCGEYYGFNMWNRPTGERCIVGSDDVRDSLRDLFTTNIVARAAAYPTADFVGNLPGVAVSRGEALASGQVAGVQVSEEELTGSGEEGLGEVVGAGSDADSAADSADGDEDERQ